ncbi:hypothetical protein GEU84_001655 [Fertoebacter nigrum]|uniref:Uncharacterized protein n=1 Tax=Fertoeibacter niger TaxID=2656921 RepID=A0A8X8GXN0_9RHOB|nr:hypothetical protein [Fertoeibacter niger]NUB43075.1 hypothetical protein [Fertoeibacter niger]
MAACHSILSTLPPAALAERLATLRAAHPGWDAAVWFSRVIPASDAGPLPGAKSTASYCWQKDPDLFGVFARAIPAALHAAFPSASLLLIDEDGTGEPIPRP